RKCGTFRVSRLELGHGFYCVEKRLCRDLDAQLPGMPQGYSSLFPDGLYLFWAWPFSDLFHHQRTIELCHGWHVVFDLLYHCRCSVVIAGGHDVYSITLLQRKPVCHVLWNGSPKAIADLLQLDFSCRRCCGCHMYVYTIWYIHIKLLKRLLYSFFRSRIRPSLQLLRHASYPGRLDLYHVPAVPN